MQLLRVVIMRAKCERWHSTRMRSLGRSRMQAVGAPGEDPGARNPLLGDILVVVAQVCLPRSWSQVCGRWRMDLHRFAPHHLHSLKSIFCRVPRKGALPSLVPETTSQKSSAVAATKAARMVCCLLGE